MPTPGMPLAVPGFWCTSRHPRQPGPIPPTPTPTPAQTANVWTWDMLRTISTAVPQEWPAVELPEW